ncbi:class I SAM-dependent methyltransferase [Amycolatopsis sp. H6(2020)]|nr:class I SAM-dependent methyltransferase [Amycolatopsis sp. H6(2020)]
MLDAVEAMTADLDRPRRILDLASGPGSISLRVLKRWPDAEVTLVDLDPVLLTIARASVGGRIVSADLRSPDWCTALAGPGFDAVLTMTSLHWLTADRITQLYGEVRSLLRPGGLFVNIDEMVDERIPTLTEQLTRLAARRRTARYSAAAVLPWDRWWEHVAEDPVLGSLTAQRLALFGGEHIDAEWTPPASWHIRVLEDTGFREAGLLWRARRGSAAAAIR